MRIDKVLQYNFNDQEEACLIAAWIINWCWWAWWQDFDKTIKTFLESLSSFDKTQAKKLYEDIKKICWEHDVDFRLKVWFTKANYRMSKKVYLLINKWAWKRKSFSLACIIFLLLQKYGQKYYV